MVVRRAVQFDIILGEDQGSKSFGQGRLAGFQKVIKGIVLHRLSGFALLEIPAKFG